MTEKQFVKKAIVGGWKQPWDKKDKTVDFEEHGVTYDFVPYEEEKVVAYEEIFLDPLAWQAVGKVSGWGKDTKMNIGKLIAKKMYSADYYLREGPKYRMHQMIDALWDGKSIKEFLSKI